MTSTRLPAGGSRRSFRLGFWAGAMAAGPISLLIVAALSLTQCGRAKDPSAESAGTAAGTAAVSNAQSELDDIVVAKVGRRSITGKDLSEKLRIQFPDMATLTGNTGLRQRLDVLRAMVDQYAWVDHGERKGYDKDPEFRATLELSRKFILANHTANREVYSKSKATPEQLRRHYEENQDLFQLVARANCSMILVATQGEAARLRARVAAGEDFAGLARQHTLDDATRNSGGMLGTVTSGSTITGYPAGDDLNRAIMALPAGALSDPIQTSRGWAVIRVHDRMEHSVQPFEEAAPSIQKKLDAKNANELFVRVLASIKEETGAKLVDEGWTRYMVSFLTEDELYQLAVGEPKPDTRINFFRALQEQHPQGRRAPAALFMVGFTLAEEKQDYNGARVAFREMLEKYPQSELTKSAEWMLEHMEEGLENLPYAGELKRRAQSATR